MAFVFIKRVDDMVSKLGKTRQFVVGLLILLLQVIIQYVGMIITQSLWPNYEIDVKRPFLYAYFENSLFSIYLVFCFFLPWKDYCRSSPKDYTYLDPEKDDDDYYIDVESSLSKPVFVPVKSFEKESDCEISEGRSVRFNKLAEVRQMSEAEARDALLSRMSYQPDEVNYHWESTFRKTTRLAFISSLLGAFITSAYYLASYLGDYVVGTCSWYITSMLNSFLFCALATPIHIMERPSLSKFFALIVCNLGLINIFFSVITQEFPYDSRLRYGAFLAMLSTMIYCMALLIFRFVHFDVKEEIPVPLLLGLSGAFSFITQWTFILIVSPVKYPPVKYVMFMMTRSLFKIVLPTFPFLWGFQLTSGLVATTANCLIIPLSITLQDVALPSMYYFSTATFVFGFVAVATLTCFERWDPVWDLLSCCCMFFRRRSRRFRTMEDKSEQSEALIDVNCNDYES